MQFDKNAILGFVLLALMFLGFFYFTRQGQLDVEQQRKRIQDSIIAHQPPIDTSAVRMDSVQAATQSKVASAGQFVTAVSGSEKEAVLENDVLKITFTNKGAQPSLVQLKKYKSIDSQSVKLVEGNFDKLSYPVNTEANRSIQISELYFDGGAITNNADGGQSISYQLKDSSGQGVVHRFTLYPGQYMIDHPFFLVVK